jgi:hypothetical protein
MNDMSRGGKRISSLCEERNSAVRLNGKICVGQDLQAVLYVLFCAGGGSVVPGHPGERRLGDTRRAGGVCTLDEFGDSVKGGRRRPIRRPRRSTWLDRWVGW